MRVRARGRSVRRRGDEGAQAVEFALVLPILLTVVFGIITFGIVFAQQLALGNGARQGARLGAVPNSSCAEIISETMTSTTTIAMPGPDLVEVRVGADDASASACSSGTAPCEGSDPGDNVYVTARFDSEPLVPLIGTIDLTGTGVFRCEYS
jgi:Flp pilus assembly protein TadG